MLQEELDMLFLLEHFSLEDLVKAEEEYVNYQCANTDNIAESYCDVEEYIDDECTTTVTTREYSTCTAARSRTISLSAMRVVPLMTVKAAACW